MGSEMCNKRQAYGLKNCALALHVQKDSRVKSLLQIQLPIQHPSGELDSTSQSSEDALKHSLPDLPPSSFSNESGSPSIVSYRSLVISAGKGHMEYSQDPEPKHDGKLPTTDYDAQREKNKEHQLLVWGHRIAINK